MANLTDIENQNNIKCCWYTHEEYKPIELISKIGKLKVKR